MIWANSTIDATRIEPTKSGEIASCPKCQSPVRAYCGHFNVWHWEHIKAKDCDTWSEPESIWHKGWKSWFPVGWQERVIDPHRADVQGPSGLVLEFQNSPISIDEIQEREEFYDNMIWIFNAAEWKLRHDKSRSITGIRRYISACLRPVYLDVGKDKLIRLINPINILDVDARQELSVVPKFNLIEQFLTKLGWH